MNVARQLADPGSLLNLYRQLLALRRATPALQWGAYVPIDDVPADCFVFMRRAEDQQALVALNLSTKGHQLSLPARAHGTVALSTYLDREGAVDLARLVLRPNEGVIVMVQP